MKFIVRLALIFYSTMVLFLGGFMLVFVLQAVPFDETKRIMEAIYSDHELRIILGCVAGGVLFLNYFLSRAISGEHQREKTIAFDNPYGRVTVSLSAVEDLIKRVVLRLPEIKEVRPTIKAGKRGLDIQVRLVLNTDFNIPEITAHLQEMIKRRIQETINMEGNVVVRVHVSKILTDDIKKKRKDRHFDEDPNPEPNVPFQGYRA